ncbi:MAG: hypothetical protein ACOC91_00795 [bacterium]
MRLLTESELTSRSDAELAILFQRAAESLATTQPGTPERQAAITSLQNISRAQACRQRRSITPGL